MSLFPNLSLLTIATGDKRKRTDDPEDYYTDLDRYDWAVSASQLWGERWQKADTKVGTRTRNVAFAENLKRGKSESGSYNFGLAGIPLKDLPDEAKELLADVYEQVFRETFPDADPGNKYARLPNKVFIRWSDSSYERVTKINGEEVTYVQYPEEAQHRITDELTMTLQLATDGLTPRVLLAMPVMVNKSGSKESIQTLYTDRGDHPTCRTMVYVFEDGNMALSSFFWHGPMLNDAESSKLAYRILELVGKISDRGFLLLDNKPGNMVVDTAPGDRYNTDFVVYAIDIDPIFSAQSRQDAEISADCAEFLNFLIFLTAMYGYPMDYAPAPRRRAFRKVFVRLLERLEELLGILMERREHMSFLCDRLLLDSASAPRDASVYDPGREYDQVRKELASMLRIEDDDRFQAHSLRVTFRQLLNYARQAKLDDAIFERLRDDPAVTLLQGAVHVLRGIANEWDTGTERSCSIM